MRQDLGSEVGNVGVKVMGNVATKMIDALLALIKAIYDKMEKNLSVEHKLDVLKLRGAKLDDNQRKAVEKIDGIYGFVAHKKLIAANVPLTVLGVSLDKNDFRELGQQCKREGIVISAVGDGRKNLETGAKEFMLECKESDVTRFRSLVLRLNDDKMVEKIQNHIETIKGKGEISNVDRMTIDGLKNEIDVIRNKNRALLNDEQTMSVVERVVDGKTQRGVDFDSALDRWTGGKIDKETVAFVVDAKDPNKYIVCVPQKAMYNEKEYIKTDYKIFNQSKLLLETNDGRFDGRSPTYWIDTKKQMKETSQMSDTVIKFYSLEEYQKFLTEYKSQNQIELTPVKNAIEESDYATAKTKLEQQLNKCGATYQNGAVLDSQTGKAMTVTNEMTDAQKTNVAEATLIGRQIHNIESLSNIENEIALARSEVLITQTGTPAHTAATEKLAELENEKSELESTKEGFISGREEINAMQSENIVRSETEKELSKTVEERAAENEKDPAKDINAPEKTRTMEAYKDDIKNNRAQKAAATPEAPDLSKTSANKSMER